MNTVPKKRWFRILPAVFLMYCINMIDRNNIGFAFPGMESDLGIGATYAGLAGGIFAIGYLFLQVPGGLWAERWSAKKLIGVALIAWGIFAAATGFIRNVTQLLIVRFMIGFVEGCILPAIVLLLKRWFPLDERARANGIWMLSIPFAAMIMSPICGFILTYATWREMFWIEGAFPIIFCIIWMFCITDHPKDAKWLSEEERNYLVNAAAKEESKIATKGMSVMEALKTRNVIILIAIWFLTQTGFAGYSIWLPTMMKDLTGSSQMLVGLLTSVPWFFAMIMLTLNSRHSDKTGERRFHMIVPAVTSALCLLASTLLASSGNVTAAVIALICCGGLIQCYYGIWWAIPTTFLTADVLAVTLGVINAVGNLGGFFGPWLFGYFTTVTGSSLGGMVFLVAASIVAPLLLLFLKKDATKAPSATAVPASKEA